MDIIGLDTEIMNCYRGICEHTHNFHLPYNYFGNKFMYICARCLGIYGGVVMWFLVLIVYSPLIVWVQSLNFIFIPALCFVLTSPLVIDWWLQCKGVRHSSNLIRLSAGLLAALSGVLMLIAYQVYWITVPSGFIWYLMVTRIGKRWKRVRPFQWGCRACRGELPIAIPVVMNEMR